MSPTRECVDCVTAMRCAATLRRFRTYHVPVADALRVQFQVKRKWTSPCGDAAEKVLRSTQSSRGTTVQSMINQVFPIGVTGGYPDLNLTTRARLATFVDADEPRSHPVTSIAILNPSVNLVGWVDHGRCSPSIIHNTGT